MKQIEKKLRIDANTTSVAISHHEGSFPGAIGYMLSLRNGRAFFRVSASGQMTMSGYLPFSRFYGFDVYFNSLNLQLKPDTGWSMPGSSTTNITVSRRYHPDIIAYQGGYDSCGTLHGDISSLVYFIKHIPEVQSAVCQLKMAEREQQQAYMNTFVHRSFWDRCCDWLNQLF